MVLLVVWLGGELPLTTADVAAFDTPGLDTAAWATMMTLPVTTKVSALSAAVEEGRALVATVGGSVEVERPAEAKAPTVSEPVVGLRLL